VSRRILVSLIIPIFNEEKNIKPLYLEIKKSLTKINQNFEIVFVNDGSADRSEEVLKKLSQKDPRVLVFTHQKNLGKPAAQATGFKAAKGELLITMDSDLQDDPREIPKFIKKISSGYDLVSGRRVKRQDAPFVVLTSKMMNFLIFFLFGHRFHDFYCGFKAFRREILKKFNLHGDLYRFLPLLALQQGFRVVELPVKHRHRRFGKSSYSKLKRIKRALADLSTIFFVIKYPRFSIFHR